MPRYVQGFRVLDLFYERFIHGGWYAGYASNGCLAYGCLTSDVAAVTFVAVIVVVVVDSAATVAQGSGSEMGARELV